MLQLFPFRTIARGSIGLLILPLLLSAQEKKTCWLRDAAAPAPATAFLLCEQGGIWTTANGGSTWSPLSTGSTQRHRSFAWLDAHRGVVAGNDGTILATEDGGKTWQPRDSGVKVHLMSVTFVGESGWIAGYQGAILHSADGGKTWARQISGSTLTLESISFLDRDHGWAAGWSGTLLRTTDGGRTWTHSKMPAAQWSLTSVRFTDLNTGWLTGFAGQLLRSKDGGATWTLVKVPVPSSLNAIAFDQAGHGWIAYDDGLLMSEDHGDTWQVFPVGGRYFLGKLISVDQSLWAVGQSVVLQQQAGNSKQWKKNASLDTGRSLAEPDAPALKPLIK